MLYFILFFYFFKSYHLIKKTDDAFYKGLVISSFLSLFLMIVPALVSSIFATRDGIFVIAVSVALIGLVEAYNLKHTKKKPELLSPG